MVPATLVLLSALAAAAPAPPRAAKAPAAKAPAAKGATPPSAGAFKLKPGAAGALCLDCHGDFEQRLKSAFVHTPVRTRNCVGCHNPHASDHGKLLAADPKSICGTCHPGIVPAKPVSVHRPVADGRCRDCHDPHASKFRSNLVREGNELCASCHKPLVDAAMAAKFKHQPVRDRCTACHEPHGSAKAPRILKADVPALCLGCHKQDATFAKNHLGYPVQRARCTSCHDPHGSNAPGMLFDHVHPPVAKLQCSMCHQAPSSKTPFQTKQAGVALCRGCHSQKLAEFAARSRMHEPVAEGACLACHGPHASKSPGLVRGSMLETCGRCHADTIKRQQISPTKHAPVRDGQCVACHDPHGSETPLNFVKTDTINLCGSCHDWQKHSTHPIGPDKKDPRNRNLTMDCLSCHRGHGTEYAHMLPFAKTTDMCVKCHEQFKR